MSKEALAATLAAIAIAVIGWSLKEVFTLAEANAEQEARISKLESSQKSMWERLGDRKTQ